MTTQSTLDEKASGMSSDHAATLLGNIAGVDEVVDNTKLEATAGQ